MLAIGYALVAKPKLLLLDEPFMGLSPVVVAGVAKVTGDIRRGGGLLSF